MYLHSKINWFGLAGGIVTILLIAISVFVPWWRLTVGDSLVAANVSPIYTNFNLVGNSFTVPLLFAINLSCILLSLVGGVMMLTLANRAALVQILFLGWGGSHWSGLGLCGRGFQHRART